MRERVWAEVDLDAVRRNFGRIAERTGRRAMVVLKADAYGLGAVPIARAVEQAGAAMIGVGDSTEAIELREAGIAVPIVVLGAIVDGEIEAVVRYQVSTTIHTADRLKRLTGEARRQNRRAPVHVMVDTGMGRLGASPARALELLDMVSRDDALVLEGTATHFSTPDDPDFTFHQLELFEDLIARARAAGIPTGACHAAATQALWRFPRTHLDLVRPGVLIQGIDPADLGVREAGFEPILALRTQVIFLKDVPAGTPIGYCRTHVTPKATRIATLPVGYNDGFPFSASNKASVLIGGRRAHQVGRISMDYAMVDVGDLGDVRVGDTVTLVGREGGEEIRLEDLARDAGTLVYAVTCGLGKRVRHHYHGERPSMPMAGLRLPSRVDFASA